MSEVKAATLDLRGTRCPLNYVKTRLELERMEAGAELEVWLDRGEPEEQVPRSLGMDGHRVEVLTPAPGYARIRVARRG
ncbi:MAG TPA: sulfurtransferase TusA family protein [Candidatus Dormibacteraeota bacterium]|nr:sulfurtransferase TusA family protein [Candidatus Dormibacteraeota bacterium]